MFTPIDGAGAPPVISHSFNVGDTVDEMLAYINSEASLEPVMAFIDGAIPAESIRSCESFDVDLGSGSKLVEVLNFTDMDVEVRPMDVARHHENMLKLFGDVFTSLVELLNEEAEGLSGEERKAVQEWLFLLTMWGPALQQEVLAVFCPEDLEAGLLVFNGGEPTVLISEGEDVRAVILPCPEGVGGEKAQAHFYVLRQDMDDAEDISLYAVKTAQADEEVGPKELAELIAIEYGMIERDYSKDELEEKRESVVRQLIPMVSREPLLEWGARSTSFVAEIEAFV
jgi:hypothetical protein